MRKISITRALQELKLLDQRINKEINSTKFITTKKVKSEKLQNGIMTVKEFEDNAKAKFQSLNDLISRRKIIKSLIVESNAKTTVEINGVTYTVADAIERKTSIEYDKKVLDMLKRQLSSCTTNLETENARIEQSKQQFINSVVGRDSVDSKLISDTTEIANKKFEGEETVLVDPINIAKTIDKLEDDIIGFENEVDMVLSEINGITMIEIED